MRDEGRKRKRGKGNPDSLALSGQEGANEKDNR